MSRVATVIVTAAQARCVSFADLAYAYVVAQALGYLLWGAWAWQARRERALAGVHGGTFEVSRAMLIAGLALTVAAAALTYIAYAKGSPPVNPEELVSLRKLAENPTVRYDNISFRNGDPSTYLFVPFQVLIVGTRGMSRPLLKLGGGSVEILRDVRL